MPLHFENDEGNLLDRFDLGPVSTKELKDIVDILKEKSIHALDSGGILDGIAAALDTAVEAAIAAMAAKKGGLSNKAATSVGVATAGFKGFIDFDGLFARYAETIKSNTKTYYDKLIKEIEKEIESREDAERVKSAINGKYGLTVDAVLSGEKLPDTSVDLAGAKRQVNFPGKNQDDRDMARPDRGPGSYDHAGNLQGRGGKSTIDPIIFDLNGDGKVDLVSYEQSHSDIDVLGSGFKHHAGWVGPNDGLLAIDLDNDGKINKTIEWAFANQTTNVEGDTDLEALASLYDSNKDGILDSKDADWAKFRIWQAAPMPRAA